MRQLRIHADHVRCVAYSPDGRHLATAGNDYCVRLVETATRKVVASWHDLGGIMQAVAFSRDGKWLAFGGQAPTVRQVGMDALHADPVSLDLEPVARYPDPFVTGLAFIN